MASNRYRTRHDSARTLLGLASIAVGVTEFFFPEKVAQAIGVSGRQTRGILRVLGVRELAHGADLLGNRNAAPGVLARVAGDMLDGALLAAAAGRTRNKKGFATVLAMVTPLVLADVLLLPALMKR